MSLLSTPRLLISGTHSGCGKSVFGIGLATALRKRNVSVSYCVVGPQLSQATVYRRLTNRFCHTLDSTLLSEEQLLTTLELACAGADLLIIDGRGGLYDGFVAGSVMGSDYQIAKVAAAPVVLVCDVNGFGNTLAVLMSGMQSGARGIDLSGVVGNRYAPKAAPPGGEPVDRDFFECAFQVAKVPPLLGLIPEADFDVMTPRSIISQHRNTSSLPLGFMANSSILVEGSVDLERLRELAFHAPSLATGGALGSPRTRRCRIAVTDDGCFNVLFQENLDLLRFFGAELVPFSPLADGGLPRKINAVYVTGAYLNEYAADIAANMALKSALQEFVARGGILYSEGAGSAYLCQHYRPLDAEEDYEGAGLLPLRAIESKADLHYCEAAGMEESIIGSPGAPFKGVMTGEWRAEKPATALTPAFRITSGPRVGDFEGFSPGPQVINTFMLANWGATPDIARILVDYAEVVERI